MTRKEELERIAESEALCAENRNCAEIKEAFLYRLLQVEREVWEKAAIKLIGWREEDPPEDVSIEVWRYFGRERERLASWLREQQKGVEG